jgi:predicted alpha/beta superfamily hydrolase
MKVTKSENSWSLPESEALEVWSEAVRDSFAIGIARPAPLPPAIAGAAGPPRLVYVLDGSFMLGMTAAIALLQRADLIRPGFPRLLLVGVDYPQGTPNRRSHDFTMEDSVWPPMREALEAMPGNTPGGAADFLRFLEDELDPLIRSRYEVAEGPAGILGDSFGGTFTFYAFLRQSRLFDRYWLGSPGVFTTGTDYVGKFAEVVRGELVHDTRMYLSIGEVEANGPIDFYNDMGGKFRQMVEALEAHPNPRLAHRSLIYPGHTHTSVLAPAVNDAILYLYGQ